METVKVMKRLIIVELYLNFEEYKFVIESVKYLGFITTININIEADSKEIEVIIN